MAPRLPLLALSLIAAATAAPLSAAAPPGGPDTRYCMRVEPGTGSRIERVMCWTREQWAAQGVNIDADWDEEGVRTVG